MIKSNIPDVTIQEIKSRIDLVGLINEFTPVNRKLKARCPFHKDNTPSLSIQASKKFWKCFSCGRKGDAISFYKEINKLNFTDTVHVLAQRAGIGLECTEKFQLYLKRKGESRKKRSAVVGLVKTFLKKLQIAYYSECLERRKALYQKAPHDWDQYDYLVEQLIDYKLDRFDSLMKRLFKECERRRTNG